MKNILIFSLFFLSACATKQIAESSFTCGGSTSFEVTYSTENDQNRVKSIKMCSGTEGDKSARYELYGDDGKVIKRIEVIGSNIHTARALEAVGVTLQAASSDDAATKQTALKALPGVLSALVKLTTPLP